MYKHPTRRQIAQRARRDSEREQQPRAEAAMLPAHGQVVGHIEFMLHGRTVRADLLATGHHCRSYGVRVAEQVVGVMGADAAWGMLSKQQPRMMSARRL